MRIRVTIATVGLNQMPPRRRQRSLMRANPAEAKFMAVVMGRSKLKGRGAANNGGPCAKRDNVDSDNSGNNKTRKY